MEDKRRLFCRNNKFLIFSIQWKKNGGVTVFVFPSEIITKKLIELDVTFGKTERDLKPQNSYAIECRVEMHDLILWSS